MHLHISLQRSKKLAYWLKIKEDFLAALHSSRSTPVMIVFRLAEEPFALFSLCASASLAYKLFSLVLSLELSMLHAHSLTSNHHTARHMPPYNRSTHRNVWRGNHFMSIVQGC